LEALEKARMPMRGFSIPDCSFGNCEAQKPQPPICKQTLQEKIGTPCMKEDTMYATYNQAVASAITVPDNVQMTRAYFTDRLYEVRTEKSDKLLQQFGMKDMDYPRNPQAFVDLIKAGKFIIRKPDVEGDDTAPAVYYNRVSDYIRFRDPATKQDETGYEKARDALRDRYKMAKDQIWAGTDPLKTVEDFRNWIYTNA
jgi:hypothetical protein